jgi:hypothetical protein
MAFLRDISLSAHEDDNKYIAGLPAVTAGKYKGSY